MGAPHTPEGAAVVEAWEAAERAGHIDDAIRAANRCGLPVYTIPRDDLDGFGKTMALLLGYLSGANPTGLSMWQDAVDAIGIDLDFSASDFDENEVKDYISDLNKELAKTRDITRPKTEFVAWEMPVIPLWIESAHWNDNNNSDQQIKLTTRNRSRGTQEFFLDIETYQHIRDMPATDTYDLTEPFGAATYRLQKDLPIHRKQVGGELEGASQEKTSLHTRMT